MSENRKLSAGLFFEWLEKGVLILIALLTAGAVAVELQVVWRNQTIEIADILLLFLYTEVISMVGVFYRSQVIPVQFPIFIAITALARLIVLQSKDMAPETILFEASAILVLALAAMTLRFTARDSAADSTKSDHNA